MDSNAPPDKFSLLAAEEVLRSIYGDDLEGCNVSLEAVASVIHDAVKQRDLQTKELVGMYEKVVEAVRVLSTPPDRSKVASPAELQSLLSERLDTIHSIAVKTMDTTASLSKSSNPS